MLKDIIKEVIKNERYVYSFYGMNAIKICDSIVIMCNEIIISRYLLI